MWNKIKEFFKKFWYVVLVPAGLFIIHLLTGGSSRDAKLKEREKTQKKEIKETTSTIKKTEKEVDKKESEVKKSSKNVKKQAEKTKEASEKVEDKMKEDLKNKAERDAKANKYFPGI